MVKVQVGLDQRAAGSGDYTATCTWTDIILCPLHVLVSCQIP